MNWAPPTNETLPSPELPSVPWLDPDVLDAGEKPYPTYWCRAAGTNPLAGTWTDSLMPGGAGAITLPSKGTGEGAVQYEWRPGGPRAIGGSVRASGALGTIDIAYVPSQRHEVLYTLGGVEVTGVSGGAELNCAGDGDPLSLDQIIVGFEIEAAGDLSGVTANSRGRLGSIS